MRPIFKNFVMFSCFGAPLFKRLWHWSRRIRRRLGRLAGSHGLSHIRKKCFSFPRKPFVPFWFGCFESDTHLFFGRCFAPTRNGLPSKRNLVSHLVIGSSNT